MRSMASRTVSPAGKGQLSPVLGQVSPVLGQVGVCWVGLCFTRCDVGAAQLKSVWGLFSPKLEPIKIHSGSFCLGRGAKYSLWLLKGHLLAVGWVQAQWHNRVCGWECQCVPSAPILPGSHATVRGQGQFVKWHFQNAVLFRVRKLQSGICGL